MIQGTNLRLRPWCDADIPILSALRNDVATQAQLLSRARGANATQVQDWLDTRTADPNGIFFVIADLVNDDTLGFLQVINFETVDGRAELGICLVKTARGQGVAGEAILLAINHLVRQWNLRKLILYVRFDNIAAQNCYRKIGFQQCGRLKEHVYFDDNWHDVLLMEIFPKKDGHT